VTLLASLSQCLAQDTNGDDITNPSPNNFILEYNQVSKKTRICPDNNCG
jgi:hypothetical protein